MQLAPAPARHGSATADERSHNAPAGAVVAPQQRSSSPSARNPALADAREAAQLLGISRASDAKVRVRYKEVKASRGKVVRAEPVAALYEQGKVHHVRAFPALEDEMIAFTTLGYMGDGSPDRARRVDLGPNRAFPSRGRRQQADERLLLVARAVAFCAACTQMPPEQKIAPQICGRRGG